MNSETIYEVIEKLVGKIEPYADASIDSERMKNMEIFIDVLNSMFYKVEGIARQYKDSPYSSAKEIGVLADKCLINLKEE